MRLEMIQFILDVVKEFNHISYFISIPFFVFIQVIFAVFLIPCSPLTIFAGILWGHFGILVSLLASLVSTISTFLLSRYFLHEYFRKKFSKTTNFRWLSIQISNHGWKIIATTQLNPIAPASALGYLYGLTNIKLTTYSFFSFLFSIPLVVALTVFGSGFFSILQNKYNSLLFMLAALFLMGLYFLLKNKFRIIMEQIKKY